MRNQIVELTLNAAHLQAARIDSPQNRSELIRLALIIADDWVASAPENPTAYLLRAYFLEHLEQLHSALADAETVLKHDQENSKAIELRDRLAEKLNQS